MQQVAWILLHLFVQNEMRKGKSVYYWDTNLFLAWLLDEKENRQPGEMDGLAEVVYMFDRKEVFIVTSITTRGEILDSTLPVQAQNRFEDFTRRHNFTYAVVSITNRQSYKFDSRSLCPRGHEREAS